MFKVPTYDELEKKEKGDNQKMSVQSLFAKQKEKNQLLDDSMQTIAPPAAPDAAPKASSTSATAKRAAPDDDDDELLNMFIQENKDIIEKPTTTSKSSPTARPTPAADDQFKKPDVVPSEPVATRQVLKPTTTTTTTRTTYQYSGGGPMLVNSKQKGNPILKHVRNVQWKYSETLVPDYSMSKTSCAFYLSMKYHLLNPTYIHQRIRELGNGYNLRVLLAFVDIKEPNHCIKELEKISIHANLTLVLCWSNEEAGRYLETFKAFEFKSADLIMEKSTNATTAVTGPSTSSGGGGGNSKNEDVIFANNFTDFLCQIKSINKTDASTLRQTFGSIYEIAKAPKEQLSLCPGLGPSKVQRIYDTFRAPFKLADDKSAQK